MTQYSATVEWSRRDSVFTDNRYSRAHLWRFDGGLTVPASSSPQAVRVPFSDPGAVDPEEALIASVSSCHMLWFLSLAAKAGLKVESYVDTAVGRAAWNEAGKEWLERVELRPAVAFCGDREPGDREILDLHRAAHEECFIANSIRAQVLVEGSWSYSAY